VASVGPASIYDTDLQDLAIPLLPGRPGSAQEWSRPGFKSDQPIQKVLLTGDSMMIEGIGPPLERYFKAIEGIEVSRKGQYSTGLCRLDYFDWFSFLKEILVEKKPDLVVITLGANDTQDIVLENRKRLMVATDPWNEAYAERVGKLISIAHEAGARMLWLGLPIMGREPYNARVQNLNKVTQEVCDKAENCLFWDASSSLTDKNGKYGSFITVKDGRHVKVRAKDSIHLTDEGGKQMLSDLLDDSPFLTAEYLQNPAALAFQATTADQASSAFQAPSAGQAPALAQGAPEMASEATSGPALSDQVITIKAVTSSGGVIPETGPSLVAQNQAPNQGLAPSDPAQAESSLRFTQYTPAQGPNKEAASLGTFKLTETAINRVGRDKSSYLAAVPTKTPREKLPAIILLHGAEGDHKSFSKGLGRALLDMASKNGVIFIMPNGDAFGWYLDSPLKGDSQLAFHVMNEVLPDALERYPIDPNRLAILGISMGGHGALTLALNNPGRFKAVSLLSAVIDLESHKSNSTLDRYLRLAEILGPPELAREAWRQHSAYFLTRKKAQSFENLPLIMSIGTSDKLCLAENRQYDRLLTELGLKHWYLERSGDHGWNFWKAEFPTHLAFLMENI
jgi:S-formylglutathione hydrolase FrmB/lysophospholipase L1-like esterase